MERARVNARRGTTCTRCKRAPRAGVVEDVDRLLRQTRIALVHDWLVTRGGSERVLEALVELLGYPPVYTLVYEPRAFAGSPISRCRVHASGLQRLPGAASHHRWLLPLMPWAIEQFDLSGYDMVISSSHAVAKGVLTRSDQLHVSYIHTPMRYAWDLYHAYLDGPALGGAEGRRRKGRGGIQWLVVAAALHYVRLWDLASAARPDVLVANSHYVAGRIWKTYRRRAHVIHPPRAGEIVVVRPGGENPGGRRGGGRPGHHRSGGHPSR